VQVVNKARLARLGRAITELGGLITVLGVRVPAIGSSIARPREGIGERWSPARRASNDLSPSRSRCPIRKLQILGRRLRRHRRPRGLVHCHAPNACRRRSWTGASAVEPPRRYSAHDAAAVPTRNSLWAAPRTPRCGSHENRDQRRKHGTSDGCDRGADRQARQLDPHGPGLSSSTPPASASAGSSVVVLDTVTVSMASLISSGLAPFSR